ncbi:asparagine synthase-related protein [Janibacter melonis]|uniref:asparagine synthase-related protein n=1 Tax=Janibacter melonis TaxID=262209 RepID=UPI0020958D65|nr:asparagine synthase-related protein [Janibacter melonis]
MAWGETMGMPDRPHVVVGITQRATGDGWDLSRLHAHRPDLQVVRRGATTLLLARVEPRTEGDTLVVPLSPQPWPGAGAEVPPFAQARLDPDGTLTVTTDVLGFRQVYLASTSGAAAVSTSATALAHLTRAPVDAQALQTQSLLGWQAGEATPWEGISTPPHGHGVRLRDGRSELVALDAPPAPPPTDDPREAAVRVADIIREQVDAFLTAEPGAALQLTGGHDSRILLAAVPPSRRPEVTALTIAVPGSQDAPMAASLAAAHGMRHVVLEPQPPGPDVMPEVMSAAHRLDAMADPVSVASLHATEGEWASRPRLVGLGGETMRGFYYAEPVPRPGPRTVARLARWRLFPNESVAPEVLGPRLDSREESTIARLTPLVLDEDPGWRQATDLFYLHQRMRRWAGVLGSATLDRRLVVNPMMHPAVAEQALALPPRERASSTFLTRVLVELDRDLALVPLDGRPPPIVNLRTGPARQVQRSRLLAGRVARKARQRLAGRSAPSAVSRTWAAAVHEAWRADPSGLHRLADEDLLARGWVTGFAHGGASLDDAGTAFVVNLLHATSTR